VYVATAYIDQFDLDRDGMIEPPLSPSTYDSNPETENSIVMHDVVVPNNDLDATEEYVLHMLYDNALDHYKKSSGL
jgi:hypothetical protein